MDNVMTKFYFILEGESNNGCIIIEHFVFRALNVQIALERAKTRAKTLLKYYRGGHIDIFDNILEDYVGDVEV